jgi:hypothetical protein
VIRIDPRHWEDMTEIKRTQLMYHELGHCILKRPHRGGGVSIMNPLILDDATFIRYRDLLIKELFLEGPIEVPGNLNLSLHDGTHMHHNCEHH